MTMSILFPLTLLLPLLLLLPSPLTHAQTFTSCDPTKRSCPPDPALSLPNATYNLLTSRFGPTWNMTAGSITYTPNLGATFTIASKGDAPTIQSTFYIFFGAVEVWMKAAPGKGVVSTVVLQSDDLDEIDLEIVGSNTTHVENNFYGKGNKTDEAQRAKWFPTSTPAETFHNYTTRWTNDSLEWYIDGAVVRTLQRSDALAAGGAMYPQSPMNVRIGIWAAGDPANDNYTVQWAGGEIDYNAGPYTMSVQRVRVSDYSSGAEYRYGDRSGDSGSIVAVAGNSTAAETLSKAPAMSAGQRWEGLSKGAKVGVAAGAVAGVVGVLGVWAVCCVRQRRAGRVEGAVADALYEKDTAELLAYRQDMGRTRSGAGGRRGSEF